MTTDLLLDTKTQFNENVKPINIVSNTSTTSTTTESSTKVIGKTDGTMSGTSIEACHEKKTLTHDHKFNRQSLPELIAKCQDPIIAGFPEESKNDTPRTLDRRTHSTNVRIQNCVDLAQNLVKCREAAEASETKKGWSFPKFPGFK